MSWEIHITRREFWADREPGPEISFDEWKAYVDACDDMRLDGYAESGVGLVSRNPGIAVWTGHSRHGVDDFRMWFYHSRQGGEISCSEPDAETFTRMLAVAGHFNANVQTDDGEHLDENTSF